VFHRRIDTVHQSGGRSKVDRDGGWMSLVNMRRAVRAALPDDRLTTPDLFVPNDITSGFGDEDGAGSV
jgi:hypothetical protein